MNMNINEFERTKPVMTMQAINTAIQRYSALIERYEYNGQQLLMEGSDVDRISCYKQFLNDLLNIKSLLINGS